MKWKIVMFFLNILVSFSQIASILDVPRFYLTKYQISDQPNFFSGSLYL